MINTKERKGAFAFAKESGGIVKTYVRGLSPYSPSVKAIFKDRVKMGLLTERIKNPTLASFIRLVGTSDGVILNVVKENGYENAVEQLREAGTYKR